MAAYKATQVRKPANETEFEKNCVILFREILNDANVKRVGTRGQKQHGLDLIGHRDRDPKQLVGVQCKLKSGQSKLGLKELRREITQALAYTPALTEYYVVATSKDDVKLERAVQQIMQDQQAAGRVITIAVWGWDTLEERINQSEAAKLAFDPGFSPSTAAHSQKLDALLAGQTRQATGAQVTMLIQSIERQGNDAALQLPPTYADKVLREEFARVLRRRCFTSVNTARELTELAERTIDGDLSRASAVIRAEVCERAARANAVSETMGLARRFRDAASRFEPSRDLAVVEALLLNAAGDTDAAVRALKQLDDPEARTALLVTLLRSQGVDTALSYFRSTGFSAADFTTIGALNLAIKEIEAGQLQRAVEIVSELSSKAFDECPVLYLMRAHLAIACILPIDQQAAVFQGLPLDPRILQLSNRPESHAKILVACRDLQRLLGILADIRLPELQDSLAEFELWLRLEVPSTRESARNQIVAELADANMTLRRVRLALAYDISFNRDALRRYLANQREVGGWTPDQRFAAFLMAFHEGDPTKLAAFFDNNHEDLFSRSDLVRGALAGIEVEVLARIGRFEDARHHLAAHTKKGDLTLEQATELSEIVSHIEQDDEAENFRLHYAATGGLRELRLLVRALRARHDARQLALYAPQLARATRDPEDFGLSLKALFQSDQFGELVALTDEMPELLGDDNDLVALRGWSLYRLGHVVQAGEIAHKLWQTRGSSSDRELAINTSIEGGDWAFLHVVVAREAERANDLTPADLLRFARLALEIGSSYVDQFRDTALAKAPDDPAVNLAAYMLATERGEEYRGHQAHGWFQKATALSGPDGPVQSVAMRDVVAEATGWRERTEKIDQMLRRGEAPLFIVSRALRRQLLDLSLGQALRNARPWEGRVKYPVFAFSGARIPCELSAVHCVALDITAIITLQFLGLFEKVIGAFGRIVIAPSTLAMLFLDRQFIKLHQPSQLAMARRIHKLIAGGSLKVVAHDASATLQREVGRDLSSLLSAATASSGIVVRSAPVPRLDSFLEDIVDMSPFESVLTDTLSVLEFLRGQGRLDAETQSHAESYLRQADRGWGAAQPITAHSKLFLDDLAVYYLDFTGLLEPLLTSVAAVYVHRDTEEHIQQIIRHSDNADDLLDALERNRAAVHAGVMTGRISFSQRRSEKITEPVDDDGPANPTLDLLSNLTDIDIVVSDDRCLNRLPHWTDANGRCVPVASTLDVLAVTFQDGTIDEATYWSARHRLRAAGYYAVPMEAKELCHHLSRASVADHRIRETPELRSLRESVALGLINAVFVETEQPWLIRIRWSVYSAIKDVWMRTSDKERARAEANWLLSILPDPREWCTRPEDGSAWAMANQHAAIQLGLLMVFVGGTRQQSTGYFEWLEETLAKSARTMTPDIWEGALEVLKTYISRLLEDIDRHSPRQKGAAVALLIGPLPESARNPLLQDEAFGTRLNLKSEVWFPLTSDISVEIGSLHNALRAALAGRKTASVVGRDGKRLRVGLSRQRGGQATLKFAKRSLILADADLLSQGRRQRNTALTRVFSLSPLLPDEEDTWRAIAQDRAFTDREFVGLISALAETPEALCERLRPPQYLNPDTLMPDDPAYYSRLAARPTEVGDFDTYVHRELATARKALFSRHPGQALRRFGFTALGQQLIPFELLEALGSSDVSPLLQAEDPFTLVLGFELCARLICNDAAFGEIGFSFLSKLLDVEASTKRCTLFGAFTIIATINLRRRAKASDAPLFWVRLAALSHAGVLTDALSRLPDAIGFLRWAAENFYPDYLWHGVIDRRDAPRCNPDWIDPDQIHAELVARAYIAVHALPEHERPVAWMSAIETAMTSLRNAGRGLAPFLPGPFDDFNEFPTPLWPDEVLAAAETSFKKASALADVPELFALANSVIPPTSILADVERLLKLAVENSGSGAQPTLDQVRACAQIAAISRSLPVATAVINLCMCRAQNPIVTEGITDFLASMLEASAAQADPIKYRALVGTIATDLCFRTSDPILLGRLVAVFDCLGRRDERLIPALARAKAIAQARILTERR